MRLRILPVLLFVALAALVVLLSLDERGRAVHASAREQRAAEVRAVGQMASDLDELLATAAQLRRSASAVGLQAAREHFTALAQRTLDLPVVTSVAFEEAVPASSRGRFERAAGFPIDRPIAAPAVLPSLVISSALSTEVAGSSLWGLDVFTDPARRRVLRLAFASGAARATPPVSGLKRLSVGLTLYLPLARREGAPFPDVVGVSLDVARLAPELVAGLPQGTQVAIRDGGRVIAASDPAATRGASRPFSFGGRAWRLSAIAPAAAASGAWTTLLIGGLIGAGLLASGLWRLLGRLERSVRERRVLAQRIGPLFTHSPMALLVTDAEHRILEVNPALEALVGRPGGELLGRPVLDLIDSREREAVVGVVGDLAAGRSATLTGDVRLVRSDGSVVWTQLTATPQRESDGQLGGLLLQAHDVEHRRSERAELQRLAERDPLTGALNRRSFDARLEAHVAAAGNGVVPGALLVVDLDHFKQVNDTLGHAAGDRVLCAVADALGGCMRRSDALGRLGGDEFAILLADGATPAEFEEVADRLRVAVRDDVADVLGGEGADVRASVGWASLSMCATDGLDAILSAADEAMYAAKRDGVGVPTDR